MRWPSDRIGVAWLTAIALIAAGCADSAFGQDAELLKSLQDRITALEQKNAVAAQPAPTADAPANVVPAPAAPTAPADSNKLGLEASWNNGFVAQTADKAFRVHIGGRAEFDNSWFTQDDNLLLGTSNTQRLNDGSLFRRARLRADGTMWDFIDFVVEVNFANIQDASNVQDQPVQVGSVGLSDFYLTFREAPIVGNIRVGHLKAPVGLERITSSNAWYYMERSSLYDAFLGPNDYQDGFEFFDSYCGDRVTLASSFTRIGKSTVQSFGFGASDGAYAVAARLTGLPIYDDDGRTLVHLGVGWQHAALVTHQFAVASRPLLRAGSGGGSDTPNVVATGTYATPNGPDIVDFEGAVVWGPFSLSSEYAVVRVSDVFDSFNNAFYVGPHGDVTYQAAYVEGGVFLTGENRQYDRKTGTWARTIPTTSLFAKRSADGEGDGGFGAVQLVARWTYLDLVGGNPTLTPTAGARAGRQSDITLGVNWYLNPQVWVMADLIWTHIDSVVPTASGDFQGFGVRVHVDF